MREAFALQKLLTFFQQKISMFLPYFKTEIKMSHLQHLPYFKTEIKMSHLQLGPDQCVSLPFSKHVLDKSPCSQTF